MFLLLFFLSSWIHLTHGRSVKVPYQHFYRLSNANKVYVTKYGCKVTEWRGTSSLGIAGYPDITQIECVGNNTTFRFDGVLSDGHARFYLRSGTMNVNNETLERMGESFWAQIGSRISGSVNGSVFMIGGRLPCPEDVESEFSSISYNAPIQRFYRVNVVEIRDDEHINGRGVAKDMVWSSISRVDPPSVVILNCNPGKSNVSEHFHPSGAVYAPFTGRICFVVFSKTECIEPGEFRWTSPLLRYFEYFEEPQVSSPEARDLLSSIGESNLCDAPTTTNPIVFAVTNFDPDDIAGIPNFKDIPSSTMTVRSTTVITHRLFV